MRVFGKPLGVFVFAVFFVINGIGGLILFNSFPQPATKTQAEAELVLSLQEVGVNPREISEERKAEYLVRATSYSFYRIHKIFTVILVPLYLMIGIGLLFGWRTVYRFIIPLCLADVLYELLSLWRAYDGYRSPFMLLHGNRFPPLVLDAEMILLIFRYGGLDILILLICIYYFSRFKSFKPNDAPREEVRSQG